VRYSASVQTSPGTHPAPYAIDIQFFLGVKLPGHGLDHPTLSITTTKERVELYLYSPSKPSWPVIQ
jgi:hypothetical protein